MDRHRDDLLGPWQLFLVRCDPADRQHCTRPKPIAACRFRYVEVHATLRGDEAGRMQLTIVPKGRVTPSIMDGTAPLRATETPAEESIQFTLDDVERDWDDDGWTDIEEQTLGLDPRQRDSDRDGIDDGRDPAPSYAPSPADAKDEDVRILQEAIFTAFGLSESPWVLFVRDDQSRALEPWGLSAPVILDKPLKFDPRSGGPGGVFVTWRVLRKTEPEAIVELSDWEGPLAAGGQEIVLRRRGADWIVVARRTTWIS